MTKQNRILPKENYDTSTCLLLHYDANLSNVIDTTADVFVLL